jgi:hypothetical protein
MVGDFLNKKKIFFLAAFGGEGSRGLIFFLTDHHLSSVALGNFPIFYPGYTTILD